MNFGWIIPAILVVLLLVVIISNIVIVQQSRAYVVERLGAFRAVWNVGRGFDPETDNQKLDETKELIREQSRWSAYWSMKK